MLPLFVLFYLFTLAESSVSFSTAIIYDEYDLQGVTQINLDKCSTGGCSVYVSVPTWNVEVTKNIFVYSASGTNDSLYQFATGVEATTSAKNGLHLSNTQYSIMNYNKDTVTIGPIIIYVVGGETPYYGDKQVEIYDASIINNRPATNKKYTMIMSAEPYNLFVEAYEGDLKAFVRATGFDNNLDRDSKDNCRIIYDHNEGKPFLLRINSPVITINFDGARNYHVCAKIDSDNKALLDYPGIATSQGYVGCASNQYQNYRSSKYNSAVFTLKDNSGTDRDTDLNYVANIKNTDKLSFTVYTQKDNSSFSATGDGTSTITKTVTGNKIDASITNGYGSSYWLGYTPKTGAFSILSAKGICPDYTETTKVTPATDTPTTSGANELLTLLTSAIVCFFAREF